MDVLEDATPNRGRKGKRKTDKRRRSRSHSRSRSRSPSSSSLTSPPDASAWGHDMEQQGSEMTQTPRGRPPPRAYLNATATRDDVWRAITQLTRRVDGLTDAMKGLQDTIGEGLAEVAEKLEKIEASVLQNPRPASTKIPPELSASVRTTYRQLREDWHIQPTDNFRNEHNQKVTAAIMAAIKDAEPEWETSLIRKACNRAYENLKSTKKNELAGTLEDVKRRKTLTSRRDRLFKKRVLIGEKILSKEDLDHLKGSDANFVSDEESDEERMGFKVFKPKWRAPQLTKIMEQCQEELNSNRMKGVEPKENRRRVQCGLFTLRSPPASEAKQLYIQEAQEFAEEDSC